MWQNIPRIEKALEQYLNNYKVLALILHKQEKKIRFLETKATNLAMFYVGSQLVIFLTNSKPSSYQCRDWWKPFLVSITLAVGYGLNFATTILKYVRIKYAQEVNYIDQNENYRQMSYLERNCLSSTENCSIGMEVDLPDTLERHEWQHKPDVFTLYEWYIHIGATVFTLLAFTALVLYTCRYSACAHSA